MSYKGNISVYVDNSVPLFRTRLKNLMSKSGVEIRELDLWIGKVNFLKWAWHLKWSEPRIVHYLWGYHGLTPYIVPKLLGKKVIIHWIGSDAFIATSTKEPLVRALLRKIAYRMADMHLADFEPLANQIRSLGINAIVLPTVPDMALSPEDTTWPFENTVLVYLPHGKEDFYGGSIVFRLAQEFTEVKFMVVANEGKDMPQLPNVEYLGWVNLSTIWKKVKIYVRLTRTDGQAKMVIEALARGKHVIWSYEYPFCRQVRNFEDARDALRDILNNNQPNIEGMDWAQRTFEPSKMARNYKDVYLKVLS